jgi:ABC-type glycerol-3-phosphate transport system substrate-binding protein
MIRSRWPSAAQGGRTRRALLGGAVAGAGAFAVACGGAGGGAAPQATKAVGGTLTVWMPPPVFTFREGIGADVAAQFKTANPGLTIEAVDEGSGEKLKTTVAAGTPPDFFHTQSYWQTTWGVSGVVQPLDKYIKAATNVRPQDGWKLKWDELTYKGKTYAVPYSIDNRIVYMHKDLYQRAGLDVNKPPKTWEAFEDVIQKTNKQVAPGQLSVLGFDPFFGSGGRQRWLVPYWQLGGEFNSADGEKITVANEKAVAAMEWCAKLIRNQGGWDAIQAHEKTATMDYRLFINGGVANFYATLATKAQSFAKEAPDLELPVMEYPLPKDGKPATYAGGWALCVPTGAKNPDAAFQLMEFLYKPEIDLKWAQAYLRVPARQSVAKSVDFTRNDAFLKTTVEAMPYGRFVASIPGGEGILPIMDRIVMEIMSGAKGASAALKEAQDLCQVEVDNLKR